jgi:hypothetical protein
MYNVKKFNFSIFDIIECPARGYLGSNDVGGK